MLKLRGFLPYILIIFFNSFVDLGHKILIQNTLYTTDNASQFSLYSSIVNALILLPYIFLFTPSGFIADKFSKTNVLRVTALCAIPLTMLVTWSYYQGYFKFAFFMTLLLAIQSVINSPAKYGYIKEIFGKANIAKANAFVQTTAIIAILGGTFVFSVIFNHYIDAQHLQHTFDKVKILKAFAPAGFILIILSIAEAVCTFVIPKHVAVDPENHYHVEKYIKGKYLKSYLGEVFSSPVILLCILGLSIFWGVNQVLLASYGAYLKDFAGDPSTVFVQGALAVGGIGILLGATYAGRVSRGFIESGMIPIAAIGITIGLFLLPMISNHPIILLLFLVYGFFGGMLIVPLNALIQFNAKDKNLGKVLASNNFIQTIFMLVFLMANIVFTLMGGNIKIFLFSLFIVALVATIYSIITMPQSLLRYIVYFVVSKIYRINVDGLDNIPSTGGVLLLGNHTSFMDWALLQIATPRPIRFVMERSIFQKKYLKWILSRLKMIPISRGASRQSLEAIHQALVDGDVVAIFPEGRLSRNGQIGHFHDGFEKALANSGAVIIPFYLRGLWGTKSSYATIHYKKISAIRYRNISVSFGTALPDSTKAAEVKQHVMQLSISSWKQYVQGLGTIAELWLTRAKQLSSYPSLIDSSGAKFTNAELLSTVMYMQNHIKKYVSGQQRVGILLPAGTGGVIANLSLLCAGLTVVNLNYTSSAETLDYVVKASGIKTIISAHAFIKKLKPKGYDHSVLLDKLNVVYLEDFKTPNSKIAIIGNYLLVNIMPLWMLKRSVLTRSSNDDIAAILFSSGSEDKPKGVELTHRNIVGNAKQIFSVFNIKADDVVLSTLPLFHAFGLTATTIMPLIEGIPMVCHPDPTDALKIGKMVYKHRVTFMCGTSTFFGLYCRNKRLLPQMFSSLRFVIAGAERLNDNVRSEFKLKFNCDIYEGYGATEVAPVASSNLPDILDSSDWHLQVCNRFGTVGLPLPGTAFKVVDPETLEELELNQEGMILIGGTQVMKGYLNNPEKTKSVLIPDGDITWYITGDKGRIDEDGYLTIVDRYSRFAKIAGEMVSLGLVEQNVIGALKKEGVEVMAINIPDIKKGEKIVLLHTDNEIDEKILREALIAAGASSLTIPSQYFYLQELPKLGSGKRDYVQARSYVLDQITENIPNAGEY